MKKSLLVLTSMMFVFVFQVHAAEISYMTLSADYEDYLESEDLGEGYILWATLSAISRSAQEDQEVQNALLETMDAMKNAAKNAEISAKEAKQQYTEENPEETELLGDSVLDLVVYLAYQNPDESTSVLLSSEDWDKMDSVSMASFNGWLALKGINLNFTPDTNIAPVPEPSTMLLLGLGLAGLAGVGRKKFFKK